MISTAKVSGSPDGIGGHGNHHRPATRDVRAALAMGYVTPVRVSSDTEITEDDAGHP